MKKVFLLLVIGIIFLSLSAPVLAAGFGVTLPNPLCAAGNGSLCTNDFPGLIARITGYITGLIASLSTIMFVYAGILFVTSGGNPSKVDQAKKAALYAAIGIAVALAAAGLLAVITAVVGSATP